ncbi:histidine phosphatase family protein [Trueperella pyogenes]
MQLILVRHGQTYMNATHTIDTVAPGAVLTEEGWTQANDVVATLAALKPGAIWPRTSLGRNKRPRRSPRTSV